MAGYGSSVNNATYVSINNIMNPEGAPAKKLRGCSSKFLEQPIFFFMRVNEIQTTL